MTAATTENTSDTMADRLLIAAADRVSRWLNILPSEAMRDHPELVAAHARFQYLDCNGDDEHRRHEELTDVLCGLRDAAEKVANNTGSSSAMTERQTSPVLDELRSLSERERWQMYEILKAHFFKNHKTYTQGEYDRAIRLYTNLLGV